MPLGAGIFGTCGEVIGAVVDVYLDNQTGRPRWAAVTIDGHRCLVPVTEARVAGTTVWVPVTVDDEHDLDRHYATDHPPTHVISVARTP